MAKCCLVFAQSPSEDLNAFCVRHVLLLVSILTSIAPGQWRILVNKIVIEITICRVFSVTHRWEYLKSNTMRLFGPVMHTCLSKLGHHGPLVRYVKLRDAHAPGMPGTFSPPWQVSDPNMHHGTCVTYVPRYMPSMAGKNFPSIPHACATCNFTYLARCPLVHKMVYCLFTAKLYDLCQCSFSVNSTLKTRFQYN